MVTIPKSESRTRDRILRAAATLFGAKGFHATRTAEIAACAGTTERTLFKHFRTKNELYAATLLPALVDASVHQGLAQTAHLFSASRESFRAWQDRLLGERLEQSRRVTPQIRMLIVSLLTDEAVRKAFEGQWKAQVWDEAVKAIRAFQKHGVLRKDIKPEQAARLIICTNLGFVLARLIFAVDRDWDDESEMQVTGDFIECGLRATETPRPRRSRVRLRR